MSYYDRKKLRRNDTPARIHDMQPYASTVIIVLTSGFLSSFLPYANCIYRYLLVPSPSEPRAILCMSKKRTQRQKASSYCAQRSLDSRPVA